MLLCAKNAEYAINTSSSAVEMAYTALKTGKVTKTDRIAEWIENYLNIDKEEYRKLMNEFHPDNFDADAFVKRAKEQWGVKYIVLTSKHHEGFAMYDSKISDFNVVKAFGRDILRELSNA